MPKTVAGDKEKKKGKTQQAQHLAAFYTPKPVGGGGGRGTEGYREYDRLALNTK